MFDETTAARVPPRQGFNFERNLTTIVSQQLHPSSVLQLIDDPINASFSNIRQFFITSGVLHFLEGQNLLNLRGLMEIIEGDDEVDDALEESDTVPPEHPYSDLATYINDYFLKLNKEITPSSFLLLHLLGDHAFKEEHKTSLESFRPLLKDDSVKSYCRLYTKMMFCLLNIVMETPSPVVFESLSLTLSHELRNSVSFEHFGFHVVSRSIVDSKNRRFLGKC